MARKEVDSIGSTAIGRTMRCSSMPANRDLGWLETHRGKSVRCRPPESDAIDWPGPASYSRAAARSGILAVDDVRKEWIVKLRLGRKRISHFGPAVLSLKQIASLHNGSREQAFGPGEEALPVRIGQGSADHRVRDPGLDYQWHHLPASAVPVRECRCPLRDLPEGFPRRSRSRRQNLQAAANIACLALAVVGVVAFVAAHFQMTLWLAIGERQAMAIRTSYYRAVLSQEMGWFDGVSSGEVASRLGTNIDTIQAGILDSLGCFISYVTTFLGGVLLASSPPRTGSDSRWCCWWSCR